ncbi:MAG TPA: hypothetical protein VLT87_27755 [Thermoanaerobaculia bacterium]|nr:hypothetical protein [Thermoanaerobaculia bacterium]
MCSDPGRRLAAKLSRLVPAALLLALPALTACGRQGDPMPPLRAIPAPTRDLSVVQQGSRFLLSFTYPKTTPAGTALEGISAVEVLEAVRPPAPDGKAPVLDARQFETAAKERQKVSGTDLSSYIFGDRIVIDLPLPEMTADTRPEARYFAVRTVGKDGDRSDLSNVAAVVPKTPPAAPERVNATARTDGILVEWTPVENTSGYNIYRRDAQEKSYGRAIYTAGAAETSWLDATARFGKSYIYTVTALAQAQPVVESSIGSEREVRYQDRFPPPPPGELVALAEAGQVRVVWRSSDAADLAGYLVYRRGPTGDFVRVTPQPIQGTEYADTAVAPGQTYTYRVTSVDQGGNESDPGGEVRTTVQ